MQKPKSGQRSFPLLFLIFNSLLVAKLSIFTSPYIKKTKNIDITHSSPLQIFLAGILFLFVLVTPFRLQGQNTDVYTASGVWPVPNCVTTVTVEVWGGGGGGAAGALAGGNGGGGGGGYSKSVISVAQGATYSITVGAGGNAGSAGGNSWFGSATTVLARGGLGASSTAGATGGAIGIGTATTTVGGNGGNASGVSGGIGGNAGGGGGSGGGAGSNGNGPGGGGGGGGGILGAGGVGAAGQVSISYNVNPSVIISNLPIPAVCPGQTATLTAAQASTYLWAPGGATTASIAVSPASTTSYTVTGTSPGCIGTAVGIVTVYNTAAITVNSVSMCQGDSPTLTSSPALSYLWAPGGETTASINVSPNSTTTYTVTGSGCGHSSSAISTVTVDCPPVTCNNAGFENCNFSGWTGTYCLTGMNANNYPYPFQATGLNIGPANQPSSPGSGLKNNQYIMSSGFDPVVGGNILPVVDPGGGSCSARLGNTETAGRSESMEYKFVVNANNNAFTYNYAVVLSDGGHPACAQPYFKIRTWVFTSPTDSSLISCGTYDVDANNAGSITGFNKISNITVNNNSTTVWYKNWSSVTIPLSAYIGQTVSIQFITRDCCPDCGTTGAITLPTGGCTGTTGGSHFAYAYVDASCGPTSIIPKLACAGNGTLTAPAGAATYSWKGPGIVSGGATGTVTVNATGTYTVTMTTFGTAPCTYSLTYNLTLLNGVTVGLSSSTICKGGTAILAATGNASTYLWAPGGATTASIYVSPGSTTTYSVTGTSSAGCSATNTATVTVNITPTVTVSPATICMGSSSTLTASGGTAYTWSTGETTTSITVLPANTTSYSVTATINGAACPGTGTATVTVNTIPIVTLNSPTVCNGQAATVTANGANSYVWSTGASTAAMTASPTVTTTYTVIGNSLGCLDTTIATIAVNPLPVVTASSTSICNGLSATLMAGGANSYSWSTGATTMAMTDLPTVTTTYTVIGSSLSCTATAVGTVTVVYAPTVTVTPGTICIGSTATLTASGASGYSWSTGATDNPITVTPLLTSTYTVSGTGCPNTATVTVTVNPIPTVTVAPTTVCSGAAATVTAGGANSYLWSTGATTHFYDGSSISNYYLYGYR